MTMTRLSFPIPDDPEEVRERLIALEAALRDDSWVPAEWRLTPTQVEMLNILAARRLASNETFHVALYGLDPDGGPEPKIIDVQICKMRKLLAPHGIQIVTRWGQGYTLSPESRSIIRALKDGAGLGVAA